MIARKASRNRYERVDVALHGGEKIAVIISVTFVSGRLCRWMVIETRSNAVTHTVREWRHFTHGGALARMSYLSMRAEMVNHG